MIEFLFEQHTNNCLHKRYRNDLHKSIELIEMASEINTHYSMANKLPFDGVNLYYLGELV